MINEIWQKPAFTVDQLSHSAKYCYSMCKPCDSNFNHHRSIIFLKYCITSLTSLIHQNTCLILEYKCSNQPLLRAELNLSLLLLPLKWTCYMVIADYDRFTQQSLPHHNSHMARRNTKFTKYNHYAICAILCSGIFGGWKTAVEAQFHQLSKMISLTI